MFHSCELRLNQQSVIYKELFAHIEKGTYGDGPLPSLRDLARKYETSTGTIRQAIGQLKIEGYISSRHGKGNFVVDKPQKSKGVMLISQLEGHLFGQYTASFCYLMSQRPEYSLILEKAPSSKAEDQDMICSKIEAAIAEGSLSHIIFDGMQHLSMSFLFKYRKAVSLICFNSPAQLQEQMLPHVVSDWLSGGMMGVQHLKDLGCKKIAILTYQYKGRPESNEAYAFVEGCRAGLGQAKVELVEYSDRASSVDYSANFEKFYENNPGIDAIFALGDFRLVPLIPVLESRGLKVGRDVALLGYYNTPWATAVQPNLSSICIRPEQIVEKVGEMVMGKTQSTMERVIPEMIVRESTALFQPKV